MLGSPNYVSPEQAAAKRGTVGKRSDVYSLGAVLYHLLTGRPPFQGETLTDVLRQLADNDPLAPRLLTPRLPPDLETICLKCLQKEPSRRYQSAQELADELDRFLHHKPIHSRPIVRAERVWRWCRRKPALATMTALVLLLVSAVAVGSTVANFRIQRESQHAKAEAKKSQQVAEFLKDMLKGVGPSVAMGRDTAMLREILDRTAERVEQGLAGQPEVEAELRNTIGSTYLELGEHEKAESMYRTALQLRQSIFRQEHLATAESLDGLGRSLWRLGRAAEAEPFVRQSLEIRRKMFGDSHPDLATSLNDLGTLFYVQGKLNEAEPLFHQCLAMRRKLLGESHLETAKSLHNLGTLLREQGKFADAEPLLREALAVQKQQLGVAHPDLAMTEYNLGLLLLKQGRKAEAEPLLADAAAMGKKVLGDAHPLLASAFASSGATLLEQSKPAEAEPLLQQALAMQRRLLPAGHPDLLRSLHLLGTALANQGRTNEADPLFREEQAKQRKVRDNESSNKDAK